MKEIIIVPFLGLMILAFVPQLVAIAESSQEKAVLFADDMNAAIDCATRGVALEVCSPNLMEHDFTPEIDAVLEIVEEVPSEATEAQNITIILDGTEYVLTIY